MTTRERLVYAAVLVVAMALVVYMFLDTRESAGPKALPTTATQGSLPDHVREYHI